MKIAADRELRLSNGWTVKKSAAASTCTRAVPGKKSSLISLMKKAILPELPGVIGRSLRPFWKALVILALTAGCRGIERNDKIIDGHRWALALSARGEKCCAPILETVKEGQKWTKASGSLRYYHIKARNKPKYTLLLLPGDPEGKEVWAPMSLGIGDGGFAWKGLADTYDLVLIDLPAHGQATTCPPLVTAESYAYLIESAIAQIESAEKAPLRGEGLIVIGHSVGGEVAWRMASHMKTRIVRLVLLDSVGMVRKPNEIQPSEKQMAHWFTGGLLGGCFGAPKYEAAKGLKELIVDDSLIESNDIAALYQAYTNRGHNYEVSRQITIRDINRNNDAEAIERLEKISAPTLVVCGSDDPAWTLQTQGVAFRCFIPKAGLVKIQRCGHLPNVERPGVVTEFIRAWLEEPNADIEKALAEMAKAFPRPAKEIVVCH